LSLIEATVAMALLVTVLIPLTGFAVQFMSERRNEHELIALALGRQMMEETLQARSYFHQERWTADGVWRIRKTVRYTDKLIHLQVRVYRRAATKPHVDLLTIRLVS
jgi:Tfp pilus assembly protein PilV